MKLNNHGWGLNEMLIYCAILLFFLLVATFFIIQLSNSLGDAFKEAVIDYVSYADVEENVENAAVLYIEKYYDDKVGNGTITITTSNLIQYNLLDEDDLLPTDEDHSCKGYVLVKRENNEIVYNPYISCKDYKTNGYQSWRLGD